jgi:hypothetical protein
MSQPIEIRRAAGGGVNKPKGAYSVSFVALEQGCTFGFWSRKRRLSDVNRLSLRLRPRTGDAERGRRIQQDADSWRGWAD